MGGDATNESSHASGEEEQVAVNIRCSNGSKFSVQVALSSVVANFKAVIAEKCDVPANQQRLIYKGRILKDDQTLRSYGVEGDHTVHLVRGFAPPASNPPANEGTQNSAPRTVPPSNESNEGGAQPGLTDPLFPGLGLNASDPLGGGLFGLGGLPEFEQVQQQLTRNPNIMREIMNMPVVQNLMNNPEIMRNLIMNNPQMREIIDRNPELAHILNDPNTLRQTLEAARSPELMREMMRNTDRAMSNIESSPEGFNMLRRMYETVQEPFLNATTMTGNESNPFAALFGAQGNNASTNASNVNADGSSPAPNTNPLPNPWTSAGSGNAQTTTTRDAPNVNARSAGTPVGLGGLGLSDASAFPDPALMSQFMQNPAFSQMMQSLLSNPQYMNQLLNTNPQLRSMLDSNTHLREMMQNPEFMRQLTSPDTMQNLLSFQQSLMSQLGRPQTTQDNAQATATGAPLDMLMNMFNGLGAGTIARPNVPPEELYATQLTQLQEMGFLDPQENVRALIASSGNVHAAVERLLGNFGQ